MKKLQPDRFWSKVNKTDSCWIWIGATFSNGYGHIGIRSKNEHHMQNLLAHRVSWELINGPIPQGMCVCHKCDNRKCVNPSHLFLGTQKDNIRDGIQKDRITPKAKNFYRRVPKSTIIGIKILSSIGVDAESLSLRYGVSMRYIYRVRSGERCSGVN